MRRRMRKARFALRAAVVAAKPTPTPILHVTSLSRCVLEVRPFSCEAHGQENQRGNCLERRLGGVEDRRTETPRLSLVGTNNNNCHHARHQNASGRETILSEDVQSNNGNPVSSNYVVLTVTALSLRQASRRALQ